MKKLVTLILVAAIFASCSSDDDSGKVAIEGTWKMTAFNTENAYDLNGDGTISSDVMGQTNCYQNETIIFNSNNTGAEVSTSYLDIDLELVAGSTTEYEYNVACVSENTTTAFTWAKSGATVTVTQAGYVFTGTLNGDEITFTAPNSFTIEVEQGSGTAFITQDVTIVYKKQ
jgi:hypothetical protein